jgi:hypothetical protein
MTRTMTNNTNARPARTRSQLLEDFRQVVFSMGQAYVQKKWFETDADKAKFDYK